MFWRHCGTGTIGQPLHGLSTLTSLAQLPEEDKVMHSLIYIVGLIVVIVFVLSLLGLA
jgi:hypothetical protein